MAYQRLLLLIRLTGTYDDIVTIALFPTMLLAGFFTGVFRSPIPRIMVGSVFISLGGLACGHGSHDDLIARFDAEIRESPDNAGLYFKRGLVRLDHDEFQNAIADFDKAESLAPGSHPVHGPRGEALERSGKHADAKAALDKHLAANPDDAKALASRARAHAALGDVNAAATDAERTFRLTKEPTALDVFT
jgi:tetratricopeptide (TPR) repeat protein